MNHLANVVISNNYKRASSLLQHCPYAKRHIAVDGRSVKLIDPGYFASDFSGIHLAAVTNKLS